MANPESLGACADALLGDPAYGALVVPQTYGYAPSARRVAVYDSLAAKHGKIACLAWQSEWLEGPGVKEAEEAEHVAFFRSMPSCFAALAAWHWRAAKRAAGAPAPPRMTEEDALGAFGPDAVYYATRLRGASNEKAKRELNFQPRALEWLS